MKVSEKVFRNLVNNPGFKEDLLAVNGDTEKLISGLDVFVKSEYRYFYHDRISKFADKADLPIEEAHRVWHVIDMFGYSIVPRFDVETICKAIEEFIGEKNNLRVFIEKLKDEKTQNLLSEIDLVDDEIGNITPQITGLQYHLQDRKVFKENKIIRSFPVTSVKIICDSEDSKEYVFELLEDDLDDMIEGLSEIKKKLNIMKGEKK